MPLAFQNRDGGMSVDWNKYSTPSLSQQRARSPSNNGIVSFVTGDLRALHGQTVEHDPLPDNQSHSEVFGEKTEEVRLKMRALFRWEIRI